jgi:hypothetical protein
MMDNWTLAVLLWQCVDDLTNIPAYKNKTHLMKEFKLAPDDQIHLNISLKRSNS